MLFLWAIAGSHGQETAPTESIPPPEATEPVSVEPTPPTLDPLSVERYEEERLVRENVVEGYTSTWTGSYTPSWIVRYPDSAPMNTPTFLQTVGSRGEQQDFLRAQDSSINQGIALTALGTGIWVAGMIVCGGGLQSEQPAIAATGGAIFLGGIGTYYLAAVPFFRHSRRKNHPAMFLSPEEAARLVNDYNESLRAELGLPPL